MGRTSLLTLCLAGALIGGCASVPPPLEEAGVTTVTLAEVTAGTAPAQARVRWGGVIVGIRNGPTHTWIEVIDLPLAPDGSPRPTDHTDGRFIARLTGFLDPEIYTPGRRLTVVGDLASGPSPARGGFADQVPVLWVHGRHLWPRRVRAIHPWPPSPLFGSPWYPWGDPM